MKLTIYWKMMLGFSIIIILMGGVDAYVLRELYRVSETTKAALTLDVRAVDLSKQVRGVLFDEERYAQKYIVSGDTSYRSLFLDQSRLFNQYLDSLTHITSDAQTLRMLSGAERRHVWHYAVTVGHEPGGRRASTAEQRARADTLDALYRDFEDLIRVKQTNIATQVAEVEHSTSRSADAALALTIGNVVAALTLAFILSRTITRPLNLFVRGTEEVARGSFARIAVTSGGELARLAAAFNKMSESLARANTERAEMMQHISHELRMPLQTMHSAYYLLTEQQAGALNQAQMRLLGSIRDNIDKIARFSNQFLDLSRIEAGMMEFELVPTDLAAVLQCAVRDAAISAERKNITVQLDAAPVPGALANGEKCAQIFNNLLSNAIKYTNNGGTVTVKLEPCGLGIRVSIADSGIGIPEEELPRVFEKFYRAKTAVAGKTKGTGIGLALVKALTEGQGGQVRVTSTPGKGSTFTVEFPAAVKEQEAVA